MLPLSRNVEPDLNECYLKAWEEWKHPFDYQEAQQGKNVRVEMTSALAELYKIQGDVVGAVSDVAQKLNAACLIHDDIIDNDRVRRGAPAVWVKYGLGTALVSAMYGYLFGLQRLAENKNPELVAIGLKSLEDMHVGQCLDAKINAGNRLPTREEYILISETNTACLFLLILNIFQALKPLPQTVYNPLKLMLLKLSVQYRFVNDYCDMNHIPWFDKKGFAPDLDGGPKSFLMMLSGKVLEKRQRTDQEKRDIIFSYGLQGVFDRALTEIDAMFTLVIKHLSEVEEQVGRLQGTREEAGSPLRLRALIQGLDFRQQKKDNFYLTMVSKQKPSV